MSTHTPNHIFEEWIFHAFNSHTPPLPNVVVGSMWDYLTCVPGSYAHIYVDSPSKTHMRPYMYKHLTVCYGNSAKKSNRQHTHVNANNCADWHRLQNFPRLLRWICDDCTMSDYINRIREYPDLTLWMCDGRFSFLQYKYTAIQAYYASLHVELLQVVCRPRI